MKVIDVNVKNDEIWFKVELPRNTDVLIKTWYSEEEVKEFCKDAIRDYLLFHAEEYFKKREIDS